MAEPRPGRRNPMGEAMRRLILLAFSGALLAMQPALAAETPKPAPPEDSVALSPVALPVVADGRIANYVFVSVKVWLNPGYDAFALRDKEPYFRDALVRVGHRTPFVVKGDYNRIDEAKLRAAMQREAGAIIGPAAVRSIQVVSQTPQHRLPVQR
ncbi:hypothetical protein [Phenylobacterium montanum]|uniref:SPOR domain-containing protein n=1 Tax=Phenylobacterium montanum TaxID=2823693 RepID=A0A975G1W1_9CAUL|nr:hypothetical protein [Caulobacter sp. S6]QUD88977.1 hypothetical protein KCG34_03570 [Caulobacter sp. S6]